MCQCAVHFEEFEPRLQGTTRQVVQLLELAYQHQESRAAILHSAQSGLKVYASKVMSTLKGFPELGSSQQGVMTRLRGLAPDSP